MLITNKKFFAGNMPCCREIVTIQITLAFCTANSCWFILVSWFSCTCFFFFSVVMVMECSGLLLNFLPVWIKGTVLGLYEDSRYKSESKKVHLKQADIIVLGSGTEVDQKLQYANDLSLGMKFGWELVNSPANVLTPAQQIFHQTLVALHRLLSVYL